MIPVLVQHWEANMGKANRIAGLTALMMLGGIVSSWWLVERASAQVGRTDAFTFFIPYASEELLAQFAAGNNSVAQMTDLSIQTNISIPIHRAGTVIYYDHWEDGYEIELTLPIQPSTQIWGDGDLSNGVAPTVRDQGGGDSLQNDDVIVLKNQVLLPNGLRDPSVIYYDGGDVLTALGGSIAVTEVAWPLEGNTLFPGSLYTDAWELYPTSRWGRLHIVPVGEDLAPLRPGFQVTGINIQAAQPDTDITISDKNGGIKAIVTLGYGEQFMLINGITSGDRIESNRPVQVQAFTADPTEDYEERGFTLVPYEAWQSDYIAPRSARADFWLYNPHAAPLTVTVTMSQTAANLVIPPQQTARYSNNGAELSTATGIRFQANDLFYGMVALDPAEVRDWGYDLQPVNLLTTQALIGWAPGNNQEPPTGGGNYSPVYVTALAATTITVHYADGTPDTQIFVPPLAEVPITSPTEDMTGAFLYTTDGTPFIAVWGEQPSAPGGQPAIDAGSNIVPIYSLALQKSFFPRNSLDCSGAVHFDDTLGFTLAYYNNAAYGGDVTLNLQDALPPELIYVAGSTHLNGQPVADGLGGIAPFSPAAGGVTTTVGQGESGLLSFETVITNAAAIITNQGQASSPLFGQTIADITIPLQVDSPPILRINETLLAPTDGVVSPTEVITFGVTITNTSSQLDVPILTLRDSFNPAELTFIAANPPPDIIANGVLTWTNLVTETLLPPGQTVTVILTFMVNQVPTTVTTIANTVTINGATRDDPALYLICSADARVTLPGPPITPTITPSITPSPTTGTPPVTTTPSPSTTPGSPTPTPTWDTGTSPPPTPPPGLTPTPSGATPTPEGGTPGAGMTLTPGPGVEMTLTPGYPPGAGTAPLPVGMLPETGQHSRSSLNLRGLVIILGLISLWLWQSSRRRR